MISSILIACSALDVALACTAFNLLHNESHCKTLKLLVCIETQTVSPLTIEVLWCNCWSPGLI